jgi:ABC-2 type transport system permease protein
VLGLLLVIENLAQIPWKPLQLISPLLTGAAGSKILMTQAQINAISHGSMGAATLGPWQGFAVLLAWVAVLLRHRNA